MLTWNSTKTKRNSKEQGFTLIELSIVLVIIGLIVGGVLVGQDLIRAAEVRATISQIEKYNTAVNTFRGKFNAIPGDMSLSTATTFGFSTANRGAAGQGDGNGVIDGCVAQSTANASNFYQAGCETGMFWVDLSSSVGGNLIDGGFTTATEAASAVTISTTQGQYMPAAKLGRGNYIYVFENGGANYYGMSNVSSITSGAVTSTGTLSVLQAYNIDKKVDDGIANTGNIQAAFVSGTSAVTPPADWTNSLGNLTTSTMQPGITISTSAHAAASMAGTDCFANDTGAYAVGVNNGAGANCGISFKMQ